MRPISYADLVRALSVAKTDEEAEGMANALGFEKKDEQVPDTDSEAEKEDE